MSNHNFCNDCAPLQHWSKLNKSLSLQRRHGPHELGVMESYHTLHGSELVPHWKLGPKNSKFGPMGQKTNFSGTRVKKSNWLGHKKIIGPMGPNFQFMGPNTQCGTNSDPCRVSFYSIWLPRSCRICIFERQFWCISINFAEVCQGLLWYGNR